MPPRKVVRVGTAVGRVGVEPDVADIRYRLEPDAQPKAAEDPRSKPPVRRIVRGGPLNAERRLQTSYHRRTMGPHTAAEPNRDRDANRRYVGADPYVRRLLNAQMLQRIENQGW